MSTVKFFMLNELNFETNEAIYEEVGGKQKITLRHDLDFINHLDLMVDEGVCFYIDTETRKIVQGE